MVFSETKLMAAGEIGTVYSQTRVVERLTTGKLLQRGEIVRSLIAAVSLLALSGCIEKDSSAGTYTFDEIVQLRLSGDSSIDGREILISSTLKSTFGSGVSCLAVVNPPCADPATENLDEYERLDEYGHEFNGEGPTCSWRIYLNASESENFEVLEIDYAEHTEFYMLTEPVSVDAVFEAKVEYTDEVNYCDKKIYKGTRIKLSEGEHEKLLNVLRNATGN